MTSRQRERYDAMRDDMLQGGNEYQNVAQPSVRTSVAVWKVPRQRLAPAKARSSVVKSGDSGSIEPSLNSVFPDFPTARLVASVKHFDWASFAEIINADHSLVNEDAALLTISAKAKLLWDATRYREAEGYFRTAALLRTFRSLSYHRATYYLLALIREDDEFVLQDLKKACYEERERANDGTALVDHEDTQEESSPCNSSRDASGDAHAFAAGIARIQPQQLIRGPGLSSKKQSAHWFTKGKLFKTWNVIEIDEHATSRILQGSKCAVDSKEAEASSSRTEPGPLKGGTGRKFALYLLVIHEGSELCLTVRAKFSGREGRRSGHSRATTSQARTVVFERKNGITQEESQSLKKAILVRPTSDEVPRAQMCVDFARMIPRRVPLAAEEIGRVAEGSQHDFERCCTRTLML